MAHEIHEKDVLAERRFRIWSSITDSYVTGELTKEELFDALLAERVERAATDEWQGFQGELKRTKKKAKWDAEREDETKYPKGYFEDRIAELTSVKVSVDLKTSPDGTKTIKVVMVPFKKKT